VPPLDMNRLDRLASLADDDDAEPTFDRAPPGAQVRSLMANYTSNALAESGLLALRRLRPSSTDDDKP